MAKKYEHTKPSLVDDTKTIDRISPSAIRSTFLHSFSRKLEMPMLILAFIWLVDILVELVNGMNPFLMISGTVLWTLFILYFSLRLFLAPSRKSFLRRHWIFILAILVPVLRLFPQLQSLSYVRLLTATFGIQVIWIFAAATQVLHSIRRNMARKGAGYALMFALVVIGAGAAGMLRFEDGSPDSQGIHSYPKAVWWVAMQITNIGSAYQPVTTAGLILALAISIFAFASFGYLTAIFASILIGKDTQDPTSGIPNQTSILQLSSEVALLRKSMEEILKTLNGEKDVASGGPPLAQGEDHPIQGEFGTATEAI
jgi:voltage-gated potassium channel